jgi:four helix bundle protein
MKVTHFTQLKVWQRAAESRDYIYHLRDSGPVTRNFDMRNQMRDAADSAVDNTAEGFGRYGHREFARFLTIAKSSLDENESQLLGGLKKRYFTPDQVATGVNKIVHARRALLGG